jgi:hypothetical protein
MASIRDGKRLRRTPGWGSVDHVYRSNENETVPHHGGRGSEIKGMGGGGEGEAR